ncbi:general stress protein [Cellulomonas sp. 179-A 4D5 NHS]|uniref:general stress protein n=1 Tax=Cellulomonas sp. 179-A 4D5 NHS TaxID=3142378 RepID=UPI0039A2EC71
MSMNKASRVPTAPTLPQGELVASYSTYLEAQRAVDHLADKQFAVQLVTIVGTDLRMVERVTGRLSYPRVALAGFASGAWFGLFVGLLLSLFSEEGSSTFFAAILIGGGFGLLFSVITYSLTGGKRDFTSSSQIVASQYAVLCAAEQAHKARNLLQEIGGVQSGWPARPTTGVTPPSDPSGAYPAPGAQQPVSGSPTVPPVTSPGVTPPSAPPAPPTEPR